MTKKRFIFLLIALQISSCGVFETQMNDSIQVYNQGVGDRISSIEEEIRKLNKTLTELQLSSIELEDQINKQESFEPIKSIQHNKEDEKKRFESSFEMIRIGDYSNAEDSLTAFIEDFPVSSYIDDAKYWLAESLYAQMKYEQALNIFEQIVIDYPLSEKMMESILKSGFSHLELSNKTSAKAIFEKVIRDYPNSSASTLAQERLRLIQ